MKEKKMYLAPKMERFDVEIEAPIAASYRPSGGTPTEPGEGGGFI